ncbi:flavodoxin reductase [Microbacterium mangrovi]|uniref:Flavodoxin reductase n=1 Tax=Microbacterium mangrovi TaxID=1348253 RepID=A0A0B2A4S7_9MICO|nr:FAD-dependent oxidoreductase [Microbacterium mangrovi]KHK98504.1 flavodoxin reductase [Microbacterium mangrovi]
MIAALTATFNRVFALLGRFSMYRLVLLELALLAVISLLLSFGGLVSPGWADLVVTAAVLAGVCAGVDAAAQRIVRLPWRVESSLITAGILLFVLRPTIQPLGLVGIALAGAVASLSKYVLVWRGRHIFNPAATGAAVLTLVASLSGVSDLGTSAWWVGTPTLGPIVLLLGIVIVWRVEKLRVVGLFVATALVVGTISIAVQYQAAGSPWDPGAIFWQQLWSSPVLFLGAFMLPEPLTLPPRRWQQLIVAAVVGVFLGWSPQIGEFPVSLGAERALLIGNAVAFAFTLRQAVRLTLAGRRELTPTVQQLTFTTRRRLEFSAGQYLELDVPHRRPDARGTRRPFSIVSAPEDLPEVRIAFRDGRGPQSTFKRALAGAGAGDVLAATGIWGDFVLPRHHSEPLLMVAAGIGVTPFVSHLRHIMASGDRRDVVLVYVVSELAELAYRDEIAAAGVPVIVFMRDDPGALPDAWTWSGGVRLDAAQLPIAVPDLAARHAYISGPAGLVADLAPALEKAKSITTDAFSGY